MADQFEADKAKRSEKFRSVALGGASLIMLLAAPAIAAPQEEERHCVVHLAPVSPRTEDGVITASLEEGGCFPTFEQALEAGTGGEIALPEGISPGELTQSVLEGSVTAASDVMIGTEYDSTGFLGLAQLLRGFRLREHDLAGGERRNHVERPVRVGQGVRHL